VRGTFVTKVDLHEVLVQIMMDVFRGVLIAIKRRSTLSKLLMMLLNLLMLQVLLLLLMLMWHCVMLIVLEIGSMEGLRCRLSLSLGYS
jgi:hypothetical protein